MVLWAGGARFRPCGGSPPPVATRAAACQPRPRAPCWPAGGGGWVGAVGEARSPVTDVPPPTAAAAATATPPARAGGGRARGAVCQALLEWGRGSGGRVSREGEVGVVWTRSLSCLAAKVRSGGAGGGGLAPPCFFFPRLLPG